MAESYSMVLSPIFKPTTIISLLQKQCDPCLPPHTLRNEKILVRFFDLLAGRDVAEGILHHGALPGARGPHQFLLFLVRPPKKPHEFCGIRPYPDDHLRVGYEHLTESGVCHQNGRNRIRNQSWPVVRLPP